MGLGMKSSSYSDARSRARSTQDSISAQSTSPKESRLRLSVNAGLIPACSAIFSSGLPWLISNANLVRPRASTSSSIGVATARPRSRPR